MLLLNFHFLCPLLRFWNIAQAVGTFKVFFYIKKKLKKKKRESSAQMECETKAHYRSSLSKKRFAFKSYFDPVF